MKDLVGNLNYLFPDFSKEPNSQVENGNKTAGQRTRNRKSYGRIP